MDKNFKKGQRHPKTPDNAFRVSFDYQESNDRLFTLMRGKYRMTVAAKNDRGDSAKIPPRLRDGIYTNFRKVFANADASFAVYENGIAEDLIVKNALSSSFTFSVKTENVKPLRMESERRIILCDAKTEEPIFAIADPVAADTNGAFAPALLCDMDCVSEHTFRFTLHIDASWLKEKERLFPVTLRSQIACLTDSTPLLAEFEDFPADDFLFATNICHYRTPQLCDRTMPAMKTGDGWGLNIVQRIIPLSVDGVIAAYIYQDETGNQTLLGASDQPIAEADYALFECDRIDIEGYEYGHCGACREEDFASQAREGRNKYYYKNAEGTLLYAPFARVLQKNGCRYLFDELGWLIRVTDHAAHTVDIIHRGGRVTAVGDGAQHFYRFFYSGNDLAAIVGPRNDWVQYRYCGNRLSEIVYSDTRKLCFPETHSTEREITVRIEKASQANNARNKRRSF